MRFINKIYVEIQALKLVYHIQFNKWYFVNIKQPFHIIKSKVHDEVEYIYMNTKLWLKHKNKYQRAFILMRWYDIEDIRIERYNREQEIKSSKQYAQLEKDTGKSQWFWRTLLGQ